MPPLSNSARLKTLIKENKLKGRGGIWKRDGGRYITEEEVYELYVSAPSCCELCGEEMIFEGYKPWCLWQASLDRIDTSKPHTKDNCRIICFYCNANHTLQPPRICKALCHPYKHAVPAVTNP